MKDEKIIMKKTTIRETTIKETITEKTISSKLAVKRMVLALLTALICFMNSNSEVLAEAPYRTFTLDGYGYEIYQTQTAYLPYETITKFDEESFKNPQDMCVTADGLIYVADTGNSRIMVGDIEGNLVRVVGEGVLQTPMGVFVTKNGHIYVADRDRNAIVEFDNVGNVLKEYTKPSNPLYGETLSFLPLKLVVNDAGVIFTICESNTNGIVEISPAEGGTFLGYFGTNDANDSLMVVLRRLISTREQRAKMVSNLPPTPDNLGIDHKGLIYTVTRGEGIRTLKRLNIAGKNVMTPDTYESIPAAVSAGNHDNVFMISRQGFIFEFNSEGELLFIFGGSDDGTQRVGLCTLASAIDVDVNDKIYVLDSDKALIQIYEPTEFTDLLHQSLNLYSGGRYAESMEPLTEVLKMNSMFDYANKAMGRALFQEEQYEEARRYARMAKDYQGYSDASWEIRNIWLKKQLIIIFWIAILLFALVKVVGHLDKRKKILQPVRDFKKKVGEMKFFYQIKYAWYFMRHPIDGSYGVAREGRASMMAANALVVVFIIEYVIYKYMCGFLQKTVMEGRYELFTDIGLVVIVLFAMTACNYLVCTINEGEGTIKKLYCTFAYCLTPYITIMPIVFVLSHVLTLNEQFLITFAFVLVYGWMGTIFVLGVKEVNNYTVKETSKVLLLTAFTILILVLLVFIIYILWSQVFEFISAIVREVVYRIGL